MYNLKDKYVRIPANRYMGLLEKEDLVKILGELGVEEWDGFHQEAYYRKSTSELLNIVSEDVI